MHAEWAVTGSGPLADRDRLLVDRMADRDESALREIYARYGRRLLSYAARTTGSVGRAEEVVQDSLLAAWNAPRSYRGDGSLLAWLLGIVRHKSLNAIRRRPLRTEAIEDASRIADPGPTPHAQAEAREQANAMRDALSRLSPEHRDTLELVFYHGLALSDVAAVCRCPVGTVKSRLNHAKLRLRALLEGDGREEPR